MKRINALMSLWLVFMVFLTACTLIRETVPTPNTNMDVVDDPGEIESPPAVLAVAGGEQISGVGSFCWNANSRAGGTVGLCADTIGIPTARESLSVSSPFTAQFQLPNAERPEELSLIIISVTDRDEMDTGPVQWRWWPYRGGIRQALPLEQQPALELSLEPGLYAFSLFARWSESGDVTYGFLVEVQPQPTPTQTPLPELEDGDFGLPASCLLGTEHSLLYVNPVDGYCLRYPARFRVDDVYPPGIANLYGPPHDYSPEPIAASAALLVEGPIDDLTLSEAVDAWLQRRQAPPPTQRVAGVLGGEPAEIVEYLGERSGGRVVFALYEDKLYALSFYPFDERFPQAAPDVEELWQTVSDSFAFLPPETRAVATETTDPPQIAFFQATPTEVEPGDVVTLTWEASGERAIICPTTRSVLFTSEDCRQIPLSGETMFTIPVEAEESRFVDFILTVEAGGVISPMVLEMSVAFKCHTTWFFSDEPQAGICPREPITSYAVAQQFQRGMMIWIEQLGRYIILDQVSSLDTQDAGRPVYTVNEPLDIVRDTSAEVITPPVRLHAPEGEFGLVWRGDISGSPGYRETLGWALAPEFEYAAIWQCDNGLPPGAWQTCYLQGPDNEVIVFHPLGGWNPVATVEMASGKAETIGYIRDLYEQDGHPYISFDEIEWLTGADAAKAMREDGLCGSSESDCEPPNPFYIRNRDEKPIAFRVSEETAVLMQTLSHRPDGNFIWDERIDLDRFRQIFDEDSTSHLRSVPYQITVDGGVVTTIREQYVP